MNRRLFLRWASLGMCCVVAIQLTQAEQPKDERATGDAIKLKLKDFKFTPPASVADPSQAFVYDQDGERLCFYTNGGAEAHFRLASDGDYDVVLSLAGDSAKNIRPKFKLKMDDKDVGKETSLRSDDVKDYKATFALKAGEHVLSIAFTNDMYKEGEYDSNLYLYGAKVVPSKTADTKEPTK